MTADREALSGEIARVVLSHCPNPDMCWCDGLDGQPNVIHEQPPVNPYHADRIEAAT